MLKRFVTVALAVCLLGLTGCAELRNLRKQNANLKAQVESLETEMGSLLEQNGVLQARATGCQAELQKALQEAQQNAAIAAELRRAKAEAERLALEMKQLLKDVEFIGVRQGPDGSTYIVMDSNVFFAPGKDELNPEASASLDVVVDYLQKHPDQKIRIDGHTDGVPITHSGWDSNYHLGAMRALAVMQYMTGKGLDPSRAYIVSYGPNRPQVQPETPTADVAENRRVEIFIVPKRVPGPAEILEKFGQ